MASSRAPHPAFGHLLPREKALKFLICAESLQSLLPRRSPEVLDLG
jgi:hypothetical protein